MSDQWRVGGRYDRRAVLKLMAGTVVALPVVLAGCGGGNDSSGGADAGTTATDTGAATGGGSAASGDIRIAFGQPHRAGDFYVALINGARAEAEARGVELLESFAEGEVEAQLNEINTWIAQDVNALVVLALDPNAVGPLIEKAHEEDIVWVSYAFAVPGSDGVTTFDDVQGGHIVGEAAGNWINDRLGGKAQVALLGDDTIETPRIRIDSALEKMLEIAPGAEVVARQDGLLAPEALETAQTLLQAHPDLQVVICAADDGALGVSQAYANSDVDTENVFVAGWDGSKAAMEKVLAGDVIRAVGALDLEAVGRSVIWVPLNVMDGKEPIDYAAPYILVTPENRAEAERLIKAFEA